jgi:hypothetical protein
MTYLEYVERMFKAIANATVTGDSTARNFGVMSWTVIGSLPACDHVNAEQVAWEAILDLQHLNLVGPDQTMLSLTPAGREVTKSSLRDSLWPVLFGQLVPDESDLELLKKAVETTEERRVECARMNRTTAEEVRAALGLSPDRGDEVGLAERLNERGIELIDSIVTSGGVSFRVRYAGVVIATESAQNESQMMIRGLIPDWETVSVDFKREIHLDAVDQKAEFIKDIAALATTKASGSRFLVVGWDPKSRLFTTSVDPTITQDRMEQVLAAYLDPVPRIAYRTLDWESGTAGLIQVFRNDWDVPYKVKKAIGRLRVDDVLVRHGSQIEKPTPSELQALIEEGELARRHRTP